MQIRLINVSRERYTTSRDEVESKIAKWSGVIESRKRRKDN